MDELDFRLFSVGDFLGDRPFLLVWIHPRFQVRDIHHVVLYCSHGSYIVHSIIDFNSELL